MKRNISMKPLFTAAALALAFSPLAFVQPALAAKPAIWTQFGSNVAIKGFDPVAYFTDGRPVMGLAQFKTTYNGAEFRFASAAHRDSFIANPARYAPQYGGYCAWAVSQGYTAGIDPEAWRIVGGKLYLNYNKDVQAKWEKDIPGHITAANANWPRVIR
jgi:YHS domain-containing protein